MPNRKASSMLVEANSLRSATTSDSRGKTIRSPCLPAKFTPLRRRSQTRRCLTEPSLLVLERSANLLSTYHALSEGPNDIVPLGVGICPVLFHHVL